MLDQGPEKALKGLIKHVQHKSRLEACFKGLPFEDMHRQCRTKAHYRIGGDISGGCDKDKAEIVFATVGLACRWHATEGLTQFLGYGAVLLDEIGSVERGVDYSLSFEVLLAVKQH